MIILMTYLSFVRFSLEESRLALQSVLGTSAAPKTVLSAELAHHRENQEIDMAVRNSLLDLQPKKVASHI